MTAPEVIQAAMQAAVSDGVFPGGVLAVRIAGELRCLSAVGRLSFDATSRPVGPSTIYDLASLTKPLVTVTSIVRLVQQGQLELDRPIGNVLAELADCDAGRATLRDLLNHSAGLPGWRPLYERLESKGLVAGASTPDAIRRGMLQLIREEPLIYTRGERSLYSDLGFILLGLAIERVSGVALDRFYRTAVTEPLGCQALHFRPCVKDRPHAGGVVPDDLDHVAPTEWDEWRGRQLHGEVHDENAASLGGVAGHAGLFGTAEGVLAISGVWRNARCGKGSWLEPTLVKEFTSACRGIPQSSWALGWDTPSAPSSSGTYFSLESFGHLGYTGTSLWIDPTKELEVLLLSNRVHPNRKNEKIRAFRPLIHDLVVKTFGCVN